MSSRSSTGPSSARIRVRAGTSKALATTRPSKTARRTALCGASVTFTRSAATVRRAQRDRAARAQPHVAPEAHVLVDGRVIPVDPRHGEIARVGREDLDGEDVRPIVPEARRHVELVVTVGADDLA